VNEEPTERLRRYVDNIGRGMESFPAAKAAGYSDSYARVLRTRMLKNPEVVKVLERIRSEGMKMAVYDLATAMREAEAVCAFAKLHKNAMAYCKGTELRAKLSGLLIDRIEVVPVDLRGALDRAEARVVNATQLSGPPCHASPPAPLSNGATRWRPNIPGDSTAEDSEGPTDGQVS
jgi:phage terminase small subunit